MPHRKPERVKTDTSLAHERTKTDDELRKRGRTNEAKADAVIATARRRARDVVTRARHKADDKMRRRGATSDEHRVIADARTVEDHLIALEHTIADENLVDERKAHRDDMRALLANEREHTDEHLRTERLRSDADLASRDDFLAMVSHDLRNTLVAIQMSASSLLAKRDVRDVIEADAVRIQKCVVRMDRLVVDLMDLVAIDAGRLAIAPKRRQVLPLMREARDMFAPIAAAKGISLDVELKRDCIARYDDGRIFQVLDNLVGNALKFTPKGGRIRIDAEQLGREVRFAVCDSGPGIPAAEVDDIFDRYQKVSDDVDRPWLGLGLHISKRIVEAHGGKIWIESSTKGTCVYFTVPSA